MKMKPEEITAIIKKQIEDYNVEMNVDASAPFWKSGTALHTFTVWTKPCPGNCWNCLTAFTAWP